MDSQFVSVVIPAYNARDTIREAVQSALRQSHRRLEVVVVDDASTDDTVAILESIHDPRLRIIKAPMNAGEGPTRDAAIAAAHGDWIAVLDADDAWEPIRLERLLSMTDEAPGALVLADNIMHCYTVRGQIRRWRPQWSFRETSFVDGVATVDTAGYLALCPMLAKPVIPRSAITQRNIVHSTRYGADTEFLIRILNSGLKLRLTREALYLYRRTRGSMTDHPDRALGMKNMLLSLSRELVFTETEQLLLHAQIERYEREERYLPFLFQVRRGEWSRAARSLVSRPWLLAEALRRLPASISYRLQVALHGGDSR